MKSTIQTVLCLMLLMLFASNVRAQFEMDPEQIAKMLDRQVDRWAEDNRQRMELHLEEIQRITEVSEKQLKKIRIGAKGQMAKHNKQYRQQQEEMNRKMQDMEAMMQFPPEDEIKEIQLTYRNESWHRFLEKQLSPDQLEKMKNQQKRRNAVARQIAVKSFMEKYASVLFLSDKEHASMSKVIDETLGDKLSDSTRRFFMGAMVGKEMEKPLNSSLKKILPAEKFEFWKKNMMPMLGPQGPFGFFDGEGEVENESEDIESNSDEHQ